MKIGSELHYTRLERRALRRREVAVLGPAARERQPAEAAPSPAPQSPARASRGQSRSDRASAARRRTPRLPAHSARAPAKDGARTRARANGASFWASGIRIGQTCSQRPQKVEAFGNWPAFGDADQRGRQHRAHRTGIDPAVGMAADRLIDRTMVHTGAAADAAKHVLEFAPEHRRAAVVEQDDVIFIGTVGIFRAPVHCFPALETRPWRRPISFSLWGNRLNCKHNPLLATGLELG